MDVTYTISLTVTRPVRQNDYNDPLHVVADWMQTPDAKRELEKEVLRALRAIDGDCDCEVMEATVHRSPEDDQERTIADGGHDTWAEHRGER